VQVVDGGGGESELEVEIASDRVLGMHDDSAETGDIGSLECPQEGVFQESLSYALSLFRAVDGKPGQEQYRDGMSCQTGASAWRGLFMGN
jgi:hypothetical protein